MPFLIMLFGEKYYLHRDRAFDSLSYILTSLVLLYNTALINKGHGQLALPVKNRTPTYIIVQSFLLHMYT
jgi:hypothetical protein